MYKIKMKVMINIFYRLSVNTIGRSKKSKRYIKEKIVIPNNVKSDENDN